MPIPRSFAGVQQDTWGGGRPASLPAELAGLPQAGLGQMGRGPESPIRVVQTREKGRAPAKSDAPAMGNVQPGYAPGCLCVPPGRRLRGPAGGGAARDTWPRPRAASGRRERGKGGPPGDSQRRLPEAWNAAPAAQPPPRGASPDTHPRGWHDGGSGGGNPARSATDCPFPPAFLRTPLHSGKRSPPALLSGIGAPE